MRSARAIEHGATMFDIRRICSGVQLGTNELGRLVKVEEDIVALKAEKTFVRDESQYITQSVCPNKRVTVLRVLVTAWKEAVFSVVPHWHPVFPIERPLESLNGPI